VWRGDGDGPFVSKRKVLGHEFTGVVHSLGRGIDTDSLRRPLREGDRVAFPFFFPCHHCYHCVQGGGGVPRLPIQAPSQYGRPR
jgi:threonine dehydrogenase-like Zn-dependent dehydrogenase